MLNCEASHCGKDDGLWFGEAECLPRYNLVTRDLKSLCLRHLAHCTLTGLADHSNDLSAFCFGSDFFFNYQRDKLKRSSFSVVLVRTV